MSDDDRTVRAEIEVPGTPEEVWEAIATGPGITAWFVPTECDEREGGRLTEHHGPEPEMQVSAEITGWDPPRRLAYETDWAPDEGVEPSRVATEFLVEARAGGTCVVRVVNSGFGSGDGWDQALDGTRKGWVPALENLRLYLEHFGGQAASSILVGGPVPGSREDAWTAMLGALGMAPADPGERVASDADGAPDLAGTVEYAGASQMILRLERPGAGLGYLGTGGPGRTAYGFVRAQLFGDGARAIAEREQGTWERWLAAQSS